MRFGGIIHVWAYDQKVKSDDKVAAANNSFLCEFFHRALKARNTGQCPNAGSNNGITKTLDQLVINHLVALLLDVLRELERERGYLLP